MTIVYSILVFKVINTAEGKKAVMLSGAFDLSSLSFFQRGTAKEILMFGNRNVAALARPGQREVVKLKNGASCYYGSTGQRGLSCTVSTDAEYPTRVAFSLLGKALDAFIRAHGAEADAYTAAADIDLPVPEWQNLITSYQDPTTADPIARIEKDIDETKQVLVETMDELLKRGEKLEDLADKSADLSFQSRAFVKSSEKLNSCCVLL